MVSVLDSSVVDRGFIGGVMVSMLDSSVVDRGFIGGVMVSMLDSRVVDRGFIGGVMVSILDSSAVDREFKPQSVKRKTITLVFVAFPLSMQHKREKSKYWLARNQDNMSECGDMSFSELAI
jgi:hypothetical protein